VTAALAVAAVIIALDIVIWVPLALRWLRVPSVRLLPTPAATSAGAARTAPAATLPRRKADHEPAAVADAGAARPDRRRHPRHVPGRLRHQAVERVLEGERLAQELIA